MNQTASVSIPSGIVSGKSQYINSFDGLRGMAVILLMLFHGSYGLLVGGVPRVDLFAAMSGYLITLLLFREYNNTGDVKFGKFFMRRVLRLMPALIACIILSNILWWYTPEINHDHQLLANFSALFYLSNLIHNEFMGNMNQLWSLAVEEHFYLVWPFFAYFFLFRLSARNRIIVLVSIVFLLETFRVLAYMNEDYWKGTIFLIDPYTFTLGRSDCIVLGALLFFLLQQKATDTEVSKPTRLDNVVLTGIAVIYLISAFFISWDGAFWLSGGFMITNFIVVLSVYMGIRNPNHPVMTNKLFIWIGRRSYGIYLYHMSIFVFMERYRVPHSYINFIVISLIRFALAIGVSAISYQYLELPLLRLKDRFKVKVDPETTATIVPQREDATPESEENMSTSPTYRSI